MHLTHQFLIAMRAFGDWRGQRGLMGMGRLRGEGSCTDCDLVSLALQQDRCAKNCGIHDQ